MTNYEAGKKLLCGGYSSYTPTGKSYFVKAGKYGSTPHAGDVVYFYTSGLGRISHVGIVSAAVWKNGLWYIDAIEGNTAAGSLFERDGGCVALKHYEVLPSQIGGKYRINGFGTPDFRAETCSAEQFVVMARSQIGYVEKASAKNLEDFRANPGDANYTKYGAWYKLNPAQWCQMFVSWCAYMSCVCAHDYVPGWWKDGQDWHYRKPGGGYAENEWIQDGGRWYVFDGAGRMVTGWFRQGTDWYYLADDGGMLASQWLVDGKHHYYLTSSGLMARECYVRSDKPIGPDRYIYYWVDEDGRWDPKWDTELPDLKKYYCAI